MSAYDRRSSLLNIRHHNSDGVCWPSSPPHEDQEPGDRVVSQIGKRPHLEPLRRGRWAPAGQEPARDGGVRPARLVPAVRGSRAERTWHTRRSGGPTRSGEGHEKCGPNRPTPAGSSCNNAPSGLRARRPSPTIDLYRKTTPCASGGWGCRCGGRTIPKSGHRSACRSPTGAT